MAVRILNVFLTAVLLSAVVFLTFLYGYKAGVIEGEKNSLFIEMPKITPAPEPVSESNPKPAPPAPEPVKKTLWGGPELWDVINKRRVENGVNSLAKKEELCTIASIRLNELRELGKLDAHEGFSNLPERRPDLKWIYEKYNLAEFLILGYPTPEETMAAWEHTLGHKSLVSGGEWVWGCVYSQDTFGVAITAY